MSDHERAMELLPPTPPADAIPQHPANIPEQKLLCALCAFHVVNPEVEARQGDYRAYARLDHGRIVVINGQSVCLLHARYVIAPPFSAALAALREDQPDVE